MKSLAGYHTEHLGATTLGSVSGSSPSGTKGFYSNPPKTLDYYRKHSAIGKLAPTVLRCVVKMAFQRIDELEAKLADVWRGDADALRKRLAEHDGCSRWGIRDLNTLHPHPLSEGGDK